MSKKSGGKKRAARQHRDKYDPRPAGSAARTADEVAWWRHRDRNYYGDKPGARR